MSKTLNVRLILDNRTHAAFEAANPVLLKGEFGIETDTPYYRIGNGIDTWNKLKVYSRLDGEQLASLNALIDMMTKNEFGKVDDVKVNGDSIVGENKVANISIGTLTFSDDPQEVGEEASFSQNIVLHKFAKTGLELVDELDSTSKIAALTANAGNKLRAMIQNIERSKTYATISEMVSAVNAYDNTKFYPGLNLWIVATGVPDFWISSVEETSSTYEYTTDEAFVNDIISNGTIQIGFYKIAILETTKVILDDYYERHEINTLLNEIRASVQGLKSRVEAIETDATIVRTTDLLILDGGSGITEE